MKSWVGSRLLLAFAGIGSFAYASTTDHRYTAGEHVELWVNKVGPYANPQEAYEYYTLPYCAPDTKHHPEVASDATAFNSQRTQSIGEYLGGHALRHSGHDIVFDPKAVTEACTQKPLTAEQAAKFGFAVQHRWFYQMYLDDLPIWGMVGELLPTNSDKAGLKVPEKDDRDRLEHVEDVENLGDLQPYVYTTRNLVIRYNQDQIVQVDLTSDPKSLVKVEAGAKLTFSLHVQWETTTDEFHSRFDRYLDHEFFKHPIHWFSVFNSFMMVLFLMGLVALILLRTLKKDYARYGIVSDLEDGIHDVDEEGKPLTGDKASEDAGWKQVHGDVFRAPSYLPLFAALLGTGWQLVVLTLGVILFAVLGPMHGQVHEERGELLHAVIACYSLSSIVAGFVSGKFFKLYFPTTAAARRGPKTTLWQSVMVYTVLLLPTASVAVLTILNAISIVYGTINTIPFLVILKLFLIWVFVSVPLNIVGTMAGRHAGKGSGPLDHFPCRINAIPRPIPDDVPWYGKPSGLVPLAGLLSFGSIFIELYYVLTSLWNYKFYHVYGFLLGVYSILTIVVGMTSIIVVYFSLNAENYLWQWTAFWSGASTAAYVFLYGIYYFVFKTTMHGLLQTSYYFGYMALISVNLGLLCGVLGHAAASRFVRAIFQNVKVD
jgi:transmembrane 9 superfamily protein 3